MSGFLAYRLGLETGLPQSRISAILQGRRSITAGTAVRWKRYLGASARFWLGLQDDFNLEEALINERASIEAVRPRPGITG